jgi:hypothetical protein
VIESQAFGLNLRSNLPIPGLPAQPSGAEAPDLEIVLGSAPGWRTEKTPRYEHDLRDDAGEPLLKLFEHAPGKWQFSYADGTQFYLDRGRATLWATWREPLTLEDTATYLLGPIFGYFLRLTGRVCLHASAVMFGDVAVAFVGAAGAGKSTLAAGFAARGHKVLAEDVTCLREHAHSFLVLPAYPRIRLWDESARLLAPAGALPLLTPNWDKRFLALDDGRHRFQSSPAPLAAVCVLLQRRVMQDAAQLHELGGQERLSQLVANTYGTHLLDRAMREQEFAVLGRLAQRVPVRGLALADDGARLDGACAWIERHALA